MSEAGGRREGGGVRGGRREGGGVRGGRRGREEGKGEGGGG